MTVSVGKVRLLQFLKVSTCPWLQLLGGIKIVLLNFFNLWNILRIRLIKMCCIYLEPKIFFLLLSVPDEIEDDIDLDHNSPEVHSAHAESLRLRGRDLGKCVDSHICCVCV